MEKNSLQEYSWFVIVEDEYRSLQFFTAFAFVEFGGKNQYVYVGNKVAKQNMSW